MESELRSMVTEVVLKTDEQNLNSQGVISIAILDTGDAPVIKILQLTDDDGVAEMYLGLEDIDIFVRELRKMGRIARKSMVVYK